MEVAVGYIIMLTIFVVLFIAAIAASIMEFKNDITFKHHLRICEAIYRYQGDVIRNHDFDTKGMPVYKVDYEDMEDYDKTIKRFWDWGYKRILPKEKFEIIKPYLEIQEKKQ